jgi:hypothetical protein
MTRGYPGLVCDLTNHIPLPCLSTIEETIYVSPVSKIVLFAQPIAIAFPYGL